MRTAALHNLGCKVNSYETEAMQQLLEEAGYEIVPFHEKADVYIINTCSVTNIADRKSRQMLHRAKKQNPDAVVVAAGCYVQAAAEELKADLAVDVIIGNNKKKDLVPILEKFCEHHPDFSYKGARAVLAFTGYEGILGYRTSSAYTGSETYEQDRQAAAEVAQCLRDNGWELASHSWGHLDLGTVEWDRFQSDTDKWESEVESLIGPTDIILFPFGADVGDWHPYTMENERFRYLYNAGFRYFCNVDSSQYWVQLGDDYLRQGRRNLDGYRMWKDITAEAEGRPRKLDDLFRAEDIFDKSRPTPVPEM